jgi:hypothetical protein
MLPNGTLWGGLTPLLDMSARIQWLAGDFEGAIQSATEAIS